MISKREAVRVASNIPPMPAPMRAAMERDKIYIFNVGPRAWGRAMGSLGSFLIPACEPGESCSPALSYQGKPGLPSFLAETVVKTVEGTTVEYVWDFSTVGRHLANDIVGIGAYHSPEDDLSPYGVFIAAGPVPTDEEIETANSAMFERYDRLVREADQKHQVNGGMEVGDNGVSYPGITKDHVEAVKALGLDRPWAKVNRQLVPCPACERPIPQHAVRCTHSECGAVLDEAKARQFFPHLFPREVEQTALQTESAEEKRGRGRPAGAKNKAA
jgi:hypothetical protein